jgi:hypothetical protein
MPTIKDFGGFKLTMYAGDHNPPHVHLIAAGREALIALSGEVLKGMPEAKHLRRARAYIAANLAELAQKWAALNERR